MGKITCMTSRFFGLLLVMIESTRSVHCTIGITSSGKAFGNPVLPAAAHLSDCAPNRA